MIKQKMADGLSKEEIISLLKEDGKIGAYNATDEIIEALFNEVNEVEETSNNTSKASLYEEWQIKTEVNADKKRHYTKVKKVKEVRLSDEQADILNQRFHNIQYYKK